MTGAERIELLQNVARVAPKEMWCVMRGREVIFRGLPDWEPYLELSDDMTDARGIITLLDAMEGAGWETSLASPSSEWSDCRFALTFTRVRDDYTDTEFGSTRAEAVARAFVQVFGGMA